MRGGRALPWRRPLAGLLAACGLLLSSAGAQTIHIESFEVEKTHEAFTVRMAAWGEDVEVGSYVFSILEHPGREGIVPPNMYVDAEGIWRLRSDHPDGQNILFFDNAPPDLDPLEGRVEFYFSTEGWPEGVYRLTAAAINRPASGPYIVNRRNFEIQVGDSPQQPGSDIATWPAKHQVLYSEQDSYAAFPDLWVAPDGRWFTGFQARVVASHIDPRGESIRMVSGDYGTSWQTTDEPIVSADWLTGEGNLVRAMPDGWQYIARDRVDEIPDYKHTREATAELIAYIGDAHVRRSYDGGKTWHRQALEIPEGVVGLMKYLDACTQLRTADGTRLTAAYGRRWSRDADGDVIHTANDVFFLRSADDGDSWHTVALNPGGLPDPSLGFNEAALTQLPSGRILGLVRTEPVSVLYSFYSDDEGLTWSSPRPTKIEGFPAHLLTLPDGRVLATYGYREAPMGVRAAFSYDGGESWDVENEIILRADGFGSPGDQGYPITFLRPDGRLLTVYYLTPFDEPTQVNASIWNPEPYPPETNWAQSVPNALENADFQQMDAARNQPEGWYFFPKGSDADWMVREVVGVSSLCLSHTVGDPALFIYGGYNPSEMIDLTDTKRLVFSVRASTATEGTASLVLTFRDAAGNFLDQAKIAPESLTDAGKMLRLEAEVPPNAALGNFGFFVHSGEVCFAEPKLSLLPEHKDFALSVNVDYAELCFYSPELGYPDGFTEAAIKAMMADFAKAGVDRVHWRVSLSGLQTYHSKVAEVFPGSRYDPEVDPLPEERQRLADMLAQFDPLAVARREARREGIEFYLWKDLYDEWGGTESGRHASRFILENPYYQTATRDNLEVFKGVISYNYEAARAYRLAELNELLAYEPDGLYLGTRTEASKLRVDAGDEFGFEQPVVDAFEARYGTNLRRNFYGLYPDFDRELWRALRSEGLAQLLEAIAGRCQPQGVEVLLGVQDPRFERLGSPYGNALLPWHRYLAEGWIDGIISEQGIGHPAEVGAFAGDFASADTSGAAAFHYSIQLFDDAAGMRLPLEDVQARIEAARTQPVGGIVLQQASDLLGGGREAYFIPIARQIRNYLRPYPKAWWDWARREFSTADMDDPFNWSAAMPAPGSGQPILHHYLYDLPPDRAFSFSPFTIRGKASGGVELRLRGFDTGKGLMPQLEVSANLNDWSDESWTLSSGSDWLRIMQPEAVGNRFWRVVWRWE